MSADTLVKRLRKFGGNGFAIGTEAADRIEALEAAVERMRVDCADAGAALASVEQENERLALDAERMDWLADRNQSIGNVMLPTDCVVKFPHDLRAAIDAARGAAQESTA